MQQHEIHNFLTRYFQTNDCHILQDGSGYMEVQLSIHVDKELMNRPFYWHYLEKTGGTPSPMKLTLITDQNKAPKHVRGEVIHFGSPRLHQIFESTKNLASFIRLYENVQNTGANIPLHPWLCLNTKISYQCDRKKDTMLSVGLNLINGMIVDQFHDRILNLKVSPKIPDYCFTLSPLVKPQSGLRRLESVIRQAVENQEHDWADRARERLKEDMDLLDQFYDGLEEMPESYEVERAAIQEQYEPNIHIKIINGGLFYLTANAI
jgi:hypothetical protein